MDYSKINAFKFALAAGIYCAVVFFLTTLLALMKLEGFVEFAESLNRLYGSWGYSVSPKGLLMGAIWGFQEGFVHFGLFALLYNKLLRRKAKTE